MEESRCLGAVTSPFMVEPEMVRWARGAAGREEAPERVLVRLAAAGGRQGLGVRETGLETGTARQVFYSRRAGSGASSGTLPALCESWSLWAGTPFYAAARR